MSYEESFPTSEMRVGYKQVDQSALALADVGIKLFRGLMIKANAGNTGFVYVGNAAVSATNGFQLDASEEIFLPVDDPSKVYIIGSADNQDVSWIGV